jgi:hypothetical protein
MAGPYTKRRDSQDTGPSPLNEWSGFPPNRCAKGRTLHSTTTCSFKRRTLHTAIVHITDRALQYMHDSPAPSKWRNKPEVAPQPSACVWELRADPQQAQPYLGRLPRLYQKETLLFKASFFSGWQSPLHKTALYPQTELLATGDEHGTRATDLKAKFEGLSRKFRAVRRKPDSGCQP